MISSRFGSLLLFALVSSVLLGTFDTYGIDNFNDEDYNQVFPNQEDDGTLKLVIVALRHGNRTPNGPNELYPMDPYYNKTYFPYGLGQLTNVGKLTEYLLGTELRERYNSFLGTYYYPDIVEATSTDYNRTKMSLELVLAGLFPPRKEDTILGMPWQPVPYNFLPREQDKMMLGINCPKYLELYDDYVNLPSIQKKFEEHQQTFDYISEHTGLNVNSFKEIYDLNFGLTTEEEYGLALPNWTKAVYPEPMKTLAAEQYDITMGTSHMRQIINGYFLQKIIADVKARVGDKNKLSRKIHLYSFHENNVAQLLISLGVFKKHIPSYGSYVVLELHQIRGIYGFKIFYKNNGHTGLEPLKMPGCLEFCPIDVFMRFVKSGIPSHPNMCGN